MAHRDLVLKLAGLAASMFVFGFAMVPLYDAFCELTGFGGKTAAVAQTVTETAEQNRTVRIQFLASLARSAPWEFRPAISHLDVHPGRLYETHFYARNLTGEAIVAQAVPSVAPGTAAAHLKKTECFCFTTQAFQAHEARELALVFMIDPKLPSYTDTLSLSYTLFAVAE
ncbi:MAG TPA: cytochrome c oxidase assembly protein [Gammaproteobacteria bacterium]|nr:cytochrome c oxidase assembly protein [Gammaproteobacteria bacterium]